MPVAPTYPGVYIEELPSAVRTIIGVPTSITAFVGAAQRGPVNEPTLIHSFASYQRTFGGIWSGSMMSYAVYQFYQNGGSDAIIVRVTRPDATAATIDLTNGVILQAKNPGEWGNNLQAFVDSRDVTPNTTNYSLTIRDRSTNTQERFVNISPDANASRSLTKVLQPSELVSVGAAPAGMAPPAGAAPGPGQPPPWISGTGGNSGSVLTDPDFLGSQANKEGIYALYKTDIFNLLCIPPIVDQNGDLQPISTAVLDAALQLSLERRAMLILDSRQDWRSASSAAAGIAAIISNMDAARNAALYFPWILMADPDPTQGGQLRELPTSGAIAGIYARTDASRGVWKAPAGIDASVNGAQGLTVSLTDGENGDLNPIGVNCLRAFPIIRNVVWGARTGRGADAMSDQWKYIPVRRVALYIEESLYRGTKWVVFEPNDEPLCASIRLNVGAFMHNLFRQGAFQGKTPREAYLVKCDKDTTTQNDIDRGIVNILVGFAPLKPAEFVIVQIQQLAGQVEV